MKVDEERKLTLNYETRVIPREGVESAFSRLSPKTLPLKTVIPREGVEREMIKVATTAVMSSRAGDPERGS